MTHVYGALKETDFPMLRLSRFILPVKNSR